MSTNYSDLINRKNFSLNNGDSMPAVGLGTLRKKYEDTTIMKIVDEALAAGYRMFDTVTACNHEVNLKEAFETLLPKYDLERADIYVITQLSPSGYGEIDVVKKAHQRSLDKLGLDYVDLYQMPYRGAARLSDEERTTQIRSITWASLVELYDDGVVNGIGVSNFTVEHLQQLMNTSYTIIPAINQVKWHPFAYQTELLEFCKLNNIQLQAYSSLGDTPTVNEMLLQHPSVTHISTKLEVSPAQVLLAWALRHDVSVLPKSIDSCNLRQNIALNFELSSEHMRLLNELKPYKIRRLKWDASVPVKSLKLGTKYY